MRIKEASWEDAYDLAMRARTEDLQKFNALTQLAGSALARAIADRFATDMLAFSHPDDDEVIAIGGAAAVRENVVCTGFFASERFPEIARPLSRWIRGVFFPSLREAGVHRIESTTMLIHPNTHRWLTWLGLRPESVQYGAGSAGETFVVYSWVEPRFAAAGAGVLGSLPVRQQRHSGSRAQMYN